MVAAVCLPSHSLAVKPLTIGGIMAWGASGGGEAYGLLCRGTTVLSCTGIRALWVPWPYRPATGSRSGTQCPDGARIDVLACCRAGREQVFLVVLGRERYDPGYRIVSHAAEWAYSHRRLILPFRIVTAW